MAISISAASIAAYAAIAISTAISTYAAISSSESQQAAAKFNSQVARNQAQAARDAAASEIDTRREHYARLMAAQRNRQAASGIDITAGSPLMVQMDQAEQAQLDLARVRWTGESRSTNFGNEANLQNFYGRMAQRQGRLNASGSLLSGI